MICSMKMINEEDVRLFWRRLNHHRYGLTELAAFDKDSLAATGFFDNEDDFVSACLTLNKWCNVYAGRNPRPFDICSSRNSMDGRKRAKDKDIRFLTAISLDIDPVRKKGIASTDEQHEQAIRFASKLQSNLGGDVDDSGNGAYLWISFNTPIEVTAGYFTIIKKKCGMWNASLRETFRPEGFRLRIDGCFDFSRIKRVIGTFNHKAQRFSRFVKHSRPSDMVRDQILSTKIKDKHFQRLRKIPISPIIPAILPEKFKVLLGNNLPVRDLWKNPESLDASSHDWKLGMSCVEAGITRPEELAAILMNNPNGKYRRDRRKDYVEVTVRKLLRY